MKTAPRYKIFASPRYLDGFDGNDYEWTLNGKTAWLMDYEEAQRRLTNVRRKHPGADIIPGNQAAKVAAKIKR